MTFYEHEREEKKRVYDGPPPEMPEEDLSLRQYAWDYLLDRGLNPSLAIANGWYPTNQGPHDSHPRIIIPCDNSQGRIYFQCRAMDDAELRYDSPSAKRGDSLVVIRPRFPHNGAVIVEGPMDALAAGGVGLLGIGIMGNEPSTEVLEHVSRLVRVKRKVIIVPDLDHVEMGTYVLGYLGACGIKAEVRMPLAKDLAAMKPSARRRFLK